MCVRLRLWVICSIVILLWFMILVMKMVFCILFRSIWVVRILIVRFVGVSCWFLWCDCFIWFRLCEDLFMYISRVLCIVILSWLMCVFLMRVLLRLWILVLFVCCCWRCCLLWLVICLVWLFILFWSRFVVWRLIIVVIFIFLVFWFMSCWVMNEFLVVNGWVKFWLRFWMKSCCFLWRWLKICCCGCLRLLNVVIVRILCSVFWILERCLLCLIVCCVRI